MRSYLADSEASVRVSVASSDSLASRSLRSVEALRFARVRLASFSLRNFSNLLTRSRSCFCCEFVCNC